MSKGEVRYDEKGPFRLMAKAEGYVMCRRPGLMVTVKTVKEWEALSPAPVEPEEKP